MENSFLSSFIEQNKKDCLSIIDKIDEYNAGFRLSKNTSSAGYLIRHIGEVTNGIAVILGYKNQITYLTINKIDSGEKYNIETSKLLFNSGYLYLAQLIESSKTNFWNEEIQTTWFGNISRVRVLSILLFHNSHHCGQISTTIKKGSLISPQL